MSDESVMRRARAALYDLAEELKRIADRLERETVAIGELTDAAERLHNIVEMLTPSDEQNVFRPGNVAAVGPSREQVAAIKRKLASDPKWREEDRPRDMGDVVLDPDRFETVDPDSLRNVGPTEEVLSEMADELDPHQAPVHEVWDLAHASEGQGTALLPAVHDVSSVPALCECGDPETIHGGGEGGRFSLCSACSCDGFAPMPTEAVRWLFEHATEAERDDAYGIFRRWLSLHDDELALLRAGDSATHDYVIGRA